MLCLNPASLWHPVSLHMQDLAVALNFCPEWVIGYNPEWGPRPRHPSLAVWRLVPPHPPFKSHRSFSPHSCHQPLPRLGAPEMTWQQQRATLPMRTAQRTHANHTVCNCPLVEHTVLLKSNRSYITNIILENDIILFHFVSLSHKNFMRHLHGGAMQIFSISFQC